MDSQLRDYYARYGVMLDVRNLTRRDVNMFYNMYKNFSFIPLFKCFKYTSFKAREYQYDWFLSFLSHKRISFDHHSFRQSHPNVAAARVAISKYDHHLPAPQQEVFRQSNAIVDERMAQLLVSTTIFSTEEVLKDLNLNTSPGFPWVTKWTTKKQFMTEAPWQRIVNDHWNNMASGRCLVLYNTSQKRELRSAEKLDENSIREFTAAPIEVTINDGRLFRDFNLKMNMVYNKFGSMVGFTAIGGGWDLMSQRLLKHPNIWSLDGHNWDGSLSVDLLEANLTLRFRLLQPALQTEEVWGRMVGAYRAMVNGMLICEDQYIFTKGCGMNSGWVNTLNDNTLSWIRVFMYVWVLLAPDPMRNIQSFSEHVEFAVFGDDLIYSVSNAALFFNGPAVIANVKEAFGIEVTTESDCSKPLSELSFVNSGFSLEQGFWLNAADYDKMLCSAVYGGVCENPLYQYLRILHLRMCSFGNPRLREIFEEYVMWVNQVHGEQLKSCEWNGLTYDQVQLSYMHRDVLWHFYTGQECAARLNGQPHKSCFKNFSSLDAEENKEEIAANCSQSDCPKSC